MSGLLTSTSPLWPIVWLLTVLPACASSKGQPPKAAEVSSAGQPTLAQREELANAIHAHDLYAWWASDLLQSRIAERPGAGVGGWITQGDSKGGVVTFFDGSKALALARVSCESTGPASCALVWTEGEAPTEAQAQAMRARETAKADPRFEPAPTQYNSVTLPAEPYLGEPGWIVYWLAATTDPDLLVMGPHFRFLVSEDGRRVRRGGMLTRTMVVDTAPEDLPEGAQLSTYLVTHGLDDLPAETHIWATMLYRVPITVVTRSGEMFQLGAEFSDEAAEGAKP